ncbi:hypothetical protein [Flavobacterium sp. 38-13]|uniref:hypothetical protein n=1 Tax=Flavobacterium sp. 38-13 TaxID=1896168 RepID=UPI000A711729|nr:hypothetical protein [Flavobacterium sp. 38-13]
MLRINFLSRLTLILCTYITVVPCFIGTKSFFTSKQKQPLIRKTDVKTKTDTLLENLAKEDTIIIQPKETDNSKAELDIANKVLPGNVIYSPLFADSGAAL